MFKEKLRGFIAGMVVMALLTTGGVALASRSEGITAFYNNIRIVIDGELITPRDANGVTIEPFIHDGTTYLPVRAIGEAFNKEVNWDGTTSTVYIGAWAEKPFREVAVWNTPYLNVEDASGYRAYEEGRNDFLRFEMWHVSATNSVTYSTNGMAREIKGTFVAQDPDFWLSSEVQYRFYDENNNLLYTSPILTAAIARLDFSFNVGNILQIRIEPTMSNGSPNRSTRSVIENLRLISTDY